MSQELETRLTLAAGYLRRLRALFGSRGVRIRTRGSFATMVVTFCWMQEDHADAILSLGTHRDAKLIARSMIEGLCQLKWAAQDPGDRAERWRQFAWIHDWRLMQRKLRSGQSVPPPKRAQIEAALVKHGRLFRHQPATAKRGAQKSGRDPYVRHWSGKSVAQLCKEVEGQLLYEWPYADFSDLHHWSPAGVFSALRAQGSTVRLAPPSARDALPTYTVAFQCLYETMALANNTFDLGLGDALQAILRDYVRDLRPPTADSSSAEAEVDA